ncbi:MAG TPA: cation transporter [Gemmatimonadaceae bacterium]|nr:cation transporter [Gemmatimonadaceae bacterium]
MARKGWDRALPSRHLPYDGRLALPVRPHRARPPWPVALGADAGLQQPRGAPRHRRGLLAGSVALVGFGVDSVIELTASVAALWRLEADLKPARRAAAERTTLRVVGVLFLALAAYVGWDAGWALWRREAPDESAIGIAVAVASLVVMPLLARAKRRVATALGSCAPRRSRRSSAPTCPLLLGGLVLNALVGWWWADPVAALAMVPIIVREGVEGLRGHDPCGDGCAGGH